MIKYLIRYKNNKNIIIYHIKLCQFQYIYNSLKLQEFIVWFLTNQQLLIMILNY